MGGVAFPIVDIPRYIRLTNAGILKLDGLITHEFKLNEINEAIRLMKSGTSGRILIAMD